LKQHRLTFNNVACKGCELCNHVCPVHILTMDATRMNKSGYRLVSVTDISKCIGCAFCAMICPDSVIKVEQVDE
jgi:2-oxoglutarate ferredoxin oxidoreductase subunit delta